MLKPKEDYSYTQQQYLQAPSQNLKQKTHQQPNTQTSHDQSKMISPFVLQSQTALLKKDQKISQLIIKNRKLKVTNEQLKKQLQMFQKKLDETLKNRTSSQKKPRVAKQIVQNMQLKNAYKQCEIYKREIQVLKKKQQFYDQLKIENLTNQILQFQIMKQQLLEQIKILKKLNKQQEKGLIQLTGTGNYLKIVKQLEDLKQQNRKLTEKISRQTRQTKLGKITASNQKRKIKQNQIKNNQQQKKQEQKQNNQFQILKLKVDKDSKIIVFLQSQNNRLNSQLQQNKRQLQQKDRQISALRQRLSVLRRQAKNKNRIQTQPQRNNKSQLGISKIRKTKQNKYTKSDNQQPHPDTNTIRKVNEQKQNQSQFNDYNPQTQQNKKTVVKYPKLMQAGIKIQNSYKWNHHQFSSKIKQIQIVQNTFNQIIQLNFRYQKGQPQRFTNNLKTNIIKFCCEQNTNQFIKILKGGFKDNKLIYIIIQTNKGRQQKYGKYEQLSSCANFLFGQSQNQFPGAFFGQNSQDGINRIGCLIQCLK